MPANKLIPDLDACIGAAIEDLIAKYPNALRHINYGKGRWSHLFTGWRAQGNLVTRRFGDEVVATRLFSEGDALKQLAASEFNTVLSTEPTKAIGELLLSRPAGTT